LPVFRRTDDAVIVELTLQEAEFLDQIPELLDSVGPTLDDPAYSVLHRPVYVDDAIELGDLEELLSQEVQDQRLADRSVFPRWSSGQTVMTLDEAHAFLRSLNAARLVLAARAGAFEQGPAWEERIDHDPSLAAVVWLGYVQGELVRAVTPDART